MVVYNEVVFEAGSSAEGLSTEAIRTLDRQPASLAWRVILERSEIAAVRRAGAAVASLDRAKWHLLAPLPVGATVHRDSHHQVRYGLDPSHRQPRDERLMDTCPVGLGSVPG